MKKLTNQPYHATSQPIRAITQLRKPTGNILMHRIESATPLPDCVGVSVFGKTQKWKDLEVLFTLES